jgi:hypothetical protein
MASFMAREDKPKTTPAVSMPGMIAVVEFFPIAVVNPNRRRFQVGDPESTCDPDGATGAGAPRAFHSETIACDPPPPMA